MDRPVVLFIVLSLACLLAGLALGIVMMWQLAAGETTYAYRWSHVHLLLVGFVLSMIYGVAYHVLPRFGGSVLASVPEAGVHWLLHAVGTVGLILAVYLARADAGDAGYYRWAALFGLAVTLGALLFIHNLAATFGLLPTPKEKT